MANRSELEIGLKIDGAKRSFIELKNQAKSLEKSQIQMFSKEERRFMSEQAGKILSDVKSKMEQNKAAISGQVAEMKKLKEGTEEYQAAEKRVNDLLKDRTKILKTHQEYSKLKEVGAGAGAGGMLSGMGGMLGRLGRMATMGPMALLGGGALAAGGFGLSRIMGGVSTFRQGVGDRISLRGLGASDMDLQDRQRAAEAGLDAQAMRRRRVQSIRVLGRDAGRQEDVLRRAEFERGFGLEEGSQLGLMTQLRGQLGGQGANQAVMRMQSSVIASGMEDAIGPYLETATNLLAQLNENGLMNSEQMINALATLVKDGKNTPEQIARTFQTLQGALIGSSGEQNAFFQQAFASAGIGTGTIGGTQLAIESGGLFGLDRGELSDRLGITGDPRYIGALESMQRLGQFTGFEQRGGAILNQFKDVVGLGEDQSILEAMTTGTPEERDRNTQLIQNLSNRMFNTQGADGFTMLRDMERVLKEGTPEEKEEFKKKMEDAMKDPQLKRLEDINTSISGQTDMIDNLAKTVKDELGAKFIGAANTMTTLLTTIDSNIASIAGLFGLESPTEALNNQLAGEGTISQQDFDLATGGNEAMQVEASKKAADKFLENRKKIQELKSFIASSTPGSTPGLSDARMELGNLEEQQKNIFRSGMSIKGFDPSVQMDPEERGAYFRDQRALMNNADESLNPLSKMLKDFKDGLMTALGTDNQAQVVQAIKENTAVQRSKKTTVNVQSPSGVRNSKTVPN